MRLARVILATALMAPLSACAVADLVAHGVKEFDKSQNAPNVQPASAPARQAESQPAIMRDEEPPAPMYTGPSAPSRGAVTVEELPPTR